MAAGDFYVKFDSNVDQFATDSIHSLESIQGAIHSLNTEFGKLKGVDLDALIKGDAKVTERLRKALAQGLDAKGGGSGGTPGAPGGGGAGFSDHVSEMNKELTEFVTRLGTLIHAQETYTKTIQGLVKKLGGSASALPEPGKEKAPTYYNPKTGNFAGAKDAGAVAHGSQVVTNSGKAIKSVTKTQIDSASFDRLVKATKDVRDEVRAQGRSVSKAVSDALKSTNQSDSTTGTATGRKNAQRAEEQEDQRTRKQRSDDNRKAAAAEKAAKGPDISAAERERRDRVSRSLQFSQLPAEDTAKLVGKGKGQLKRTDLEQILSDLSSQGFETPKINKSTTNAKLLEHIAGAGAAYRDSGYSTTGDLRTSGRIQTETKISPEVTKALGGILRKFENALPDIKDAQAVRSLDRASGGTGRPDGTLSSLVAAHGSVQSLSSVSKAGGRDGQGQGGSRSQIFAIDKETVQNAEKLADSFDALGGKQAKKLAAKGFNPFDPSLGKGIEGEDEEAQAARKALASVRRAFQHIDEVAETFYTLPKSSEKRADVAARAGLTPADLDAEKFRTGYNARNDIDEETGLSARQRYAAKRTQGGDNYTALLSSTRQALGGTRLLPGGGKFDTTSANVGLGLRGGSKTSDGFLTVTNQVTGKENPALSRKIDNAARRYVNSLNKLLGVHESEEEAAEAMRKAEADASRLLRKIFNATGNAPRIEELFEAKHAANISPEALDEDYARQQQIKARDARNAPKPNVPESLVRGLAAQQLLAAKEAGETAKQLAARRKTLEAPLVTGSQNAEKRVSDLKNRYTDEQSGQVVPSGVAEIEAAEKKLVTARKKLADSEALTLEEFANKLIVAANRTKTRLANAGKEIAEAVEEEVAAPVAAAAGGGGKKGGGRKPPATGGDGSGAGGGDGSTNGLLKQILAAINRVDATLGGKGAGAAGPAAAARKPRINVGNSLTEEEKAQRAALLEERKSYTPQATDIRKQIKTLGNVDTSQLTPGQKGANTRKINQLNAQLEAIMARRVALDEEYKNIAVQAVAREKAASKAQGAAESRSTKAKNATATADEQAGFPGRRATVTTAGQAARTPAPSTAGTGNSTAAAAQQGGNQVVQAANRSGQQAFGSTSRTAQAMDALYGKNGFWGRIVNSTGTFIVRNFTAGFVFGVTNALQETVAQAIKTESTYVRVGNALEATGKKVGNIRGDLQKISSDYGTNLNDVYETAAGLTGLFKTVPEISSATRIASQLRTISDGAINAQEAIATLASITGGFKDELASGVDGFQHVADVLTSVQNNLGTNLEVTAEGVASLSGLAQDMKLSFEETAVYTAQIAKLTGSTGGAAGDKFSRILGSLQTGRAQGAITKAYTEGGQGGKVNAAQAAELQKDFNKQDYGAVLKNLMQNWGNLSKEQQRNISVTVAGQRQMSAFKALFSDTGKTLADVAKAENSTGDAEERMNKITKTLQVQIQKFTSNLQNLASALVQSGILDFLGIFLRVTNNVLGGINSMLSLFNKIADSNSFTKLLKHMTVGLLGFVAVLALTRKALTGLGASLAASGLTGAGTTAGRVAAAAAGGGGIRATTLALGSGIGTQRYTPRISSGGALSVRERTQFGPVTRFGPGVATLTAPVATAANGLIGFGNRALPGQGALRNGGNFLQNRAERNFRQADLTRLNAAQPSLFGGQTAKQLADQEKTALSAAARQQALARAQMAAGNSAARLSGAMGAFSLGGLAATAGIIALTYAISSYTADMAKERELRKSILAQDDQVGVTDKNSKKATDEKAYVGVNQENLDNKKGQPGNFTVGLHALGSFFKNPFGGGGIKTDSAEQRSINRDLGLEGKGDRKYGYNNATALQADANNTIKAKLDGIKATSSQVDDVSGDINDQIDKGMRDLDSDLKSGKISAQQAQAGKAMLEQVRKNVKDKIDVLAATAAGFDISQSLNDDQFQTLGRIAQESKNLNGRGVNSGGVDGSIYLKDLVEKSGIGQDDPLFKIISQMTDGRAGATKQLLLQKQLLQTEVSRLSVAVRGLPKDGDQYKALNADLESARDSLGTFMDSFNSSLLQIGQSNASFFSSRGNYKAATAALQPALKAAQKAKADLLATPDIVTPLQGPVPLGAPPLVKREKGYSKEALVAAKANEDAALQQITASILQDRVAELKRKILETVDPKIKALLGKELSDITLDVYNKQRKKFGAGAVAQQDYDSALGQSASDKQSVAQTQLAEQQAAGQTRIASLGTNALGVARATLAQAGAQKSALLAQGYTKTSVEYQSAVQQQIQAQYAISAAQGDIIQAQGNLRAAYANARGDSVGAARAGLAAARAALAFARKASGGARTAETINAQAGVVNAAAAARQAKLDDQQNTIDFNLQMGKITSAGAIAALTNILKTEKLNKLQRQALLLKIKGMKDELSNDGQFNFGDIKLPTPYSVKRYIAQQKLNQKKALASAAGISNQYDVGAFGQGGASRAASGGFSAPQAINSHTETHSAQVLINGADTGKIIQLIKQIVGGNVTIHTTQSRRK